MRRRHAALFAVAVTGLAETVVAAPKSPSAEASEAIEAVESKKAEAAIAAEPVANAKKALDRARTAREAGNDTTATLLGRLAREWAQLAVSLLKAADAERRADALEKSLAEVQTQSVRARALLEETVARRGRAQVELARLEGPSNEAAGRETAPSPSSESATPKRSGPAKPPAKQPPTKAEPKP